MSQKDKVEVVAKQKEPAVEWLPAGKDLSYCEMPTGVVLKTKQGSITFVPGVIVVERKTCVAFQAGSR